MAGGLSATLEFHASAKTECDIILAATCASGKGDIQLAVTVSLFAESNHEQILYFGKLTVSACLTVHYCSKLAKSLKSRTQGIRND